MQLHGATVHLTIVLQLHRLAGFDMAHAIPRRLEDLTSPLRPHWAPSGLVHRARVGLIEPVWLHRALVGFGGPMQLHSILLHLLGPALLHGGVVGLTAVAPGPDGLIWLVR